MEKKRIRWAPSVYGRNLPILRPRAQSILNEVFHTEEVIPRWVGDPTSWRERKEVQEAEFVIEKVQEYSDGSRRDQVAVGAYTMESEYLGRYAMVMDAELLGICLSWGSGQKTVALDSHGQGAIRRAIQLYYEPPRSWIEERLAKCLTESARRLM